MRKNKNNVVLIIILIVFFSFFKFNSEIRISILDSCRLWFKALVPSMTMMYLITDLLINYGLSNYLFKIFKTNRPFLIFISLMLGSPANAKYVCEFLENNYIDIEDAKWIMMCSYSPNPLFLITISPNKSILLTTFALLYGTNLLLGILTRNTLNKNIGSKKEITSTSLSNCLNTSISKTWNILLLVLGVVIVYGIINTILNLYFKNVPIFITSILELTNALNTIVSNPSYYKWFIFAVCFGGLSIHTQIKSILNSDALYKSFLFGRTISTMVALIIMFFY